MRVIPPVAIGDGAFTRASVGTYYDLDGILRTAAINTPRVSYNPSNLTATPTVLIEPSGRNDALRSEQFDNAVYVKNRCTVSLNDAGAPNAPDGTRAMDKLKIDATNAASHYLQQASIGSYVVGETITAYIFAAPAELDKIYFQFSALGAALVTGGGAAFHLLTGAISDISPNLTAYECVPLINGLMLCSISILAEGNGTVAVNIYPASSAGTGTSGTVIAVGDSTSGIYLWGLSVGSGKRSSYIPTTSAAVTRAPDVVTPGLAYSSVAEPSAGEVVYSLASDYLAGDVVISTAVHKKYTSLQGARSAVTISIDTAASVTWPKHELVSGIPVTFTTTGALPGGLTAGTTYYTLVTGSDTFNLAATAGGQPLTTYGSQSGVHTASSSVNRGNALPVPPETKTDWWIESGATNRWAAFDLERNTQSVGASPMAMIFAPGERINSVAVLGMVADSVAITATSDGVIVWQKTFDLRIRSVSDGYDYCFEPFDRAPSAVALDIPPFTNVAIAAVLQRSDGGDVSCGSVVVGTSVYLGGVKYGAESDAMNFSTVTRDIYGTATLVKRRTAPKTNQTMSVKKERLNKILKVRDLLDAVPAVWVGLDDALDGYFEALLILGIWKRFVPNLSDPSDLNISLELEEI